MWYDVMISTMVTINVATSYVIKLHGQYVCLSVVLLRSWCRLTLRMVFLEGGSITSLVKNPCKNI